MAKESGYEPPALAPIIAEQAPFQLSAAGVEIFELARFGGGEHLHKMIRLARTGGRMSTEEAIALQAMLRVTEARRRQLADERKLAGAFDDLAREMDRDAVEVERLDTIGRRMMTDAQRHARVRAQRMLGGTGALPPEVRAHVPAGAQQSVLRAVSSLVRKHGACEVGYDALAAMVKCCKRTAMRAIKLAEALDWIEVDRRPGPDGKNLTNVIRIKLPSWLRWIAHPHWQGIPDKRARHRVTAPSRNKEKGSAGERGDHVGPKKGAFGRTNLASSWAARRYWDAIQRFLRRYSPDRAPRLDFDHALPLFPSVDAPLLPSPPIVPGSPVEDALDKLARAAQRGQRPTLKPQGAR